MNLSHLVGLKPFVVQRQAFNTTGKAIRFAIPADAPTALKSVLVSVRVYSGTLLVNLEGMNASPWVELLKDDAFDFPIETTAIYLKAKVGIAEAGAVAALHPIEQRP